LDEVALRALTIRYKQEHRESNHSGPEAGFDDVADSSPQVLPARSASVVPA